MDPFWVVALCLPTFAESIIRTVRKPRARNRKRWQTSVGLQPLRQPYFHCSKLTLISILRSEVITAVNMSILAFCVVTPCVYRSQNFKEIICIHLQCRNSEDHHRQTDSINTYRNRQLKTYWIFVSPITLSS